MVTKTGRSFLAGASALDAALATLALLVMLLEIWIFGGLERGLTKTVDPFLASCIAVVAAGSLLFRRSNPLPAFVVNSLALVAFIAFTGPSDVYQYTNLIAIFSLGLYDRRWITSLGVLLSMIAIGFYFRSFPEEGGVTVAVAVALLWLVAWLGGLTTGTKVERDRLQTERDLNHELAEARRLRLDLETERTGMARELHDIVGHTLNVMLVHAGAARRALPENTAQAEEALAIIETTGRSAMDDLDRVLGLLRTQRDGADRAPLPGLADLPELAANASDDRLEVLVDLAVEPSDLPQAAQLAMYRIVQEALTNVLKHADASSVEISVRRNDSMAELVVIDDGLGLMDYTPSQGMFGMTQRAAIHLSLIHI